MISAFDSKPPEVPEPEDFSEKEVFAFFGLTSYYAQVLEQGLINLAVILHSRGLTRVSREDIESAFNRLKRATLGQLISDVREKVYVPEDLEKNLINILKDRNHLTHHFFAAHDVDFMAESGRKKMIEKLRGITQRIQQIDRVVEAITLPLWEKIGITKKMLEQEVEQMYTEARTLDASS